jgi:hypothetical protein
MDGGGMVRTSARKQKNREYSDELPAVKARARTRMKEMAEELDADIVSYYGKPVSEWDFEELQAGRTREPDGSIKLKGKTPKWITPAIMGEAQRRLKLLTRDQMGHYAGAAIEVMAQLMTKSRVDMVRYNAAKYILDQIIGMPTQRVEINEGPKIQDILAEFMEEVDGSRHRVIEGTVVEGDEDYDDDDDTDE